MSLSTVKGLDGGVSGVDIETVVALDKGGGKERVKEARLIYYIISAPSDFDQVTQRLPNASECLANHLLSHQNAPPFLASTRPSIHPLQ